MGDKFRVMVYGSLRKGFGNSYLLKDSTFVGMVNTRPNYTMVSLGAFPGLIRKGDTIVIGELYEVDAPTLERLDRLEGHPNWYVREEIDVAGEMGEGRAWAYFLPDEYVKYKQVQTGDWANREVK